MENEKNVSLEDAALDLDELDTVSGGEMSEKEKEKWYKVIRNAIEDGCTKEMFWQHHTKRPNPQIKAFIDNVWEVVTFADLNLKKKKAILAQQAAENGEE